MTVFQVAQPVSVQARALADQCNRHGWTVVEDAGSYYLAIGPGERSAPLDPLAVQNAIDVGWLIAVTPQLAIADSDQLYQAQIAGGAEIFQGFVSALQGGKGPK